MGVFIIAEIGINHQGDVGIAKQLIDIAVVAGCDAVKFQKRTPEIVVLPEQREVMYETVWGTIQYMEYRERIEISEVDFAALDEYCEDRNIQWSASAWDFPSWDFVWSTRRPWHKVPSAMIGHTKLLVSIAEKGRKTFISCGMCDIHEIDKAVAIFRGANCPFELMVCHSCYPAPNGEIDLRRIQTLRERYGCDVGYSGHERGLQLSLAAVALGATSIERHITLDHTMIGNDHAASLEPAGLINLVRDIRIIEHARGTGDIFMWPSEVKAREKLRYYDRKPAC